MKNEGTPEDGSKVLVSRRISSLHTHTHTHMHTCTLHNCIVLYFYTSSLLRVSCAVSHVLVQGRGSAVAAKEAQQYSSSPLLFGPVKTTTNPETMVRARA